MTNIQEKILYLTSKSDMINTLDLVQLLKEGHQTIIGALQSIQSNGELLIVKPHCVKSIELTEEGKEFVITGSHEAKIFNAIPEEGIHQSDLMKHSNAKIGLSKAMTAGWIFIDKPTGIIKKKITKISDTTRDNLKLILEQNYSQLTDNNKKEYKKRKLIQEVTIKSFDLKKGPNFSLILTKYKADLTTEVLTKGNWKTLNFKEYNFNTLGAPLQCGYLHPLLKVRTEIKQILLEMGFSEMPTHSYIESSFWNFDALFQPQNHPARDAHDTFFVSGLNTSSSTPKDYLKRVKTIHMKGGYGSLGHRYNWKKEEADKNLLRTHTTAVSARMLYSLAQEDFKPTKLFSIDKVFRNETLDATHLAEFYQVEGVIADYNLTLGDLTGIFTEFFKKLGITQLEFKSAYNPYTEPSMEIFCYHSGLHKWIEIGNSGMFRPEMLLPMGFHENVRVIAWGLSLERPTMIKYGSNNIRELVGSKVDLRLVQKSPICRVGTLL